jgi:recombination protein RecA
MALIVKAEPGEAPEPKQKEKEISMAPPVWTLSKTEKLKSVGAVTSSLNKTYDTILLQKLGKRKLTKLPSISTNLITLDEEVLGCGGFPRGRVVEVFGPESSGKTTIALHVIAEAQKAGGLAAFVDAEHALDPMYARKLGVNIDELLISQPDYGEQAIEVVLALVRARAVDVIVIDSVSALVPKAELEGDVGDAHMGLQARLMSQAMRMLVGETQKSGICVIFINQIREKVGVSFGNPEVTSGGRALKFYSSVRLEVRRLSKSDGGELKDGDTHIGHRMRVKNVKNKCGSPFNTTVVDLYYGKGFDQRSDMVEFAINEEVVVKDGKMWSFEDKKYYKGGLTEDPVYDTLVLAVKKKLKDIAAEAA